MWKLAHMRMLCRDTRGAILIETAFAAPVLAIIMLGAFDVSHLVARQMELQEVAAEIAAASMAKAPDDNAIVMLERMAQASGDLEAEQVTLTRQVKCGVEPTLHDGDYECGEDIEKSTMISISLSDTYAPMWTNFGIGEPVTLNVQRSVQVS